MINNSLKQKQLSWAFQFYIKLFVCPITTEGPTPSFLTEPEDAFHSAHTFSSTLGQISASVLASFLIKKGSFTVDVRSWSAETQLR